MDSKKKEDRKSLDTKEKKKIFKIKRENVLDDDAEKSEIYQSRTGFNLIEVVIIMVITSFISLLIGSFMTYVRFDDDRDVGCNSIRQDTEEFTNVYDNLLNEYYGEVDRDGLLKSAIVGMVSYLNDPFASYVDVNDALELEEDLKGEFIGVGIEVYMESGGKTTIVGVHTDSPAYNAGMIYGDVITKFNDKPLEGLSIDEISKLIVTNNKNDEVRFTVLRGDEEIVFHLVPNLVEIKSVDGYVKEVSGKNIGYILISNFAENTLEQFKNKYDELSKAGIDGLIIDVRGNQGGYLSVAKDISSLFLDKGAIIYQRDTKGKIEKIISENEKLIDVRVVFLTNNNTASAAEILVASLKENLDVDVVGVETYGKGTIQKLYEMSNGAYVKFTAQTWLTPRGNSVNETGIAPTHYVTLSEEYVKNPIVDNDNQLQTAFGLFE